MHKIIRDLLIITLIMFVVLIIGCVAVKNNLEAKEKIKYLLVEEVSFDNKNKYSSSIVYEHDDEGRLYKRITSNGSNLAYFIYKYDKKDRVIKEIKYDARDNSLIENSTFEYDKNDHKIKWLYYDKKGRESIRYYTYDSKGNLAMEYGKSKNTITSKYSYDNNNNCIKTENQRGDELWSFNYKYDSHENKISFIITDRYGNETFVVNYNNDYDAKSNLVRVDKISGNKSDGYVIYRYQAFDKRTYKKDNVVIKKKKSKYRMIKKIEYNSDNTIFKTYEYIYDNEGMLTIQNEKSQSSVWYNKYEYDKEGRLIKESKYNNKDRSLQNYKIYSYDISGNMFKEAYYKKNGTLDFFYIYRYDLNNIKKGYTRFYRINYHQIPVSFGYDKSGNVIKAQFITGEYISYDVDSYGNTVKESYTDLNGKSKERKTFQNKYDSVGNLIQVIIMNKKYNLNTKIEYEYKAIKASK